MTEIEIVVLDDMLCKFAEDIAREAPIPTEIELDMGPASRARISWHPRWNGLGDVYAPKVGLEWVPIRSLSQWREALTWCREFRGRAICFFDYSLEDIRIETEDVGHLSESLRLEFAESADPEACVSFFNSDQQGLLLAATLVTNSRADVDIWLASGVAIGIEKHRDALRRHAQQSVNVDVAQSTLVRVGGKKPAVDVVKKAIQAFRDRRRFPQAREFWPDCADTWFREGRSTAPAPHSFADYLELEERNHSDNLHHYLVTLGATETVATQWLRSQDCYESLKRFLGACSSAQMGNRPLSLGTLIFLLLWVTKGRGWTEDFDWKVSLAPICLPDRVRSRKLIHSVLTLFTRLRQPREPDGAPNEVRARFENRQDGDHLLVDFGFDCSSSTEPGKPSLSAKTLLFATRECPGGDVTLSLWNTVHAAFDVSEKRPTLYIALYPFTEAGRAWTRLDFTAGL